MIFHMAEEIVQLLRPVQRAQLPITEEGGKGTPVE